MRQRTFTVPQMLTIRALRSSKTGCKIRTSLWLLKIVGQELESNDSNSMLRASDLGLQGSKEPLRAQTKRSNLCVGIARSLVTARRLQIEGWMGSARWPHYLIKMPTLKTKQSKTDADLESAALLLSTPEMKSDSFSWLSPITGNRITE